MKKWVLGSLVASTLLFAGCRSEPVASTVAGPIDQDKFIEKMKNEPLQGGMTVGQSVLQKMILADVFEHHYGNQVSDEDVEAKFEKEAEQFGGVEKFKQLLEKQSLSEDRVKNNLRMNLLIRTAIKDHVEISEEDLRAAYDQQKPVAKVQHILVKDKEAAQDLLKQLNEGADFGELAGEHSIDPGSKNNEGIYTMREGEMVPDFEKAALALEVGETTSEPVETNHGFHIIRRMEFDPEADFEERKEDLLNKQIQSYASNQQFMSKMIGELMADMNIQINDEELRPAIAPFLPSPEEESEDSGEGEEESESTEETEENSEENTEDNSDAETKENTEENSEESSEE